VIVAHVQSANLASQESRANHVRNELKEKHDQSVAKGQNAVSVQSEVTEAIADHVRIANHAKQEKADQSASHVRHENHVSHVRVVRSELREANVLSAASAARDQSVSHAKAAREASVLKEVSAESVLRDASVQSVQMDHRDWKAAKVVAAQHSSAADASIAILWSAKLHLAKAIPKFSIA